jgi:hypothetical protein
LELHDDVSVVVHGPFERLAGGPSFPYGVLSPETVERGHREQPRRWARLDIRSLQIKRYPDVQKSGIEAVNVRRGVGHCGDVTTLARFALIADDRPSCGELPGATLSMYVSKLSAGASQSAFAGSLTMSAMSDDSGDWTRWPRGRLLDTSGVAVVTVNYNTAALITLLLWSLHRVLKTHALAEIVVIDNGSSDGSVELLAGLSEAGLCQLLANEANRQHGPGLNQGLSYLATRACATGRAPAWVWILDSDCVVARSDVLDLALQEVAVTDTSVVGEPQWDPWHGVVRFGSHCLLVDPARTWRDPFAAFENGGDPSFAFLASCQSAGLVLTEFGFLRNGHVIHRGRGTLARLVDADERSNPLYGWALEHHEAHFGGVSGAAERYEAITARFEVEVPRLDAATLAEVCSHG